MIMEFDRETLALVQVVASILTGVFVIIGAVFNHRIGRRLKRLESLRQDLYEQHFAVLDILQNDPYILGRLREAWPQYEDKIRRVHDHDR